MERWLNSVNNHKANGLTNPVDYQADLIVDQLDRDGMKLKLITLEVRSQSIFLTLSSVMKL